MDRRQVGFGRGRAGQLHCPAADGVNLVAEGEGGSLDLPEKGEVVKPAQHRLLCRLSQQAVGGEGRPVLGGKADPPFDRFRKGCPAEGIRRVGERQLDKVRTDGFGGGLPVPFQPEAVVRKVGGILPQEGKPAVTQLPQFPDRLLRQQ